MKIPFILMVFLTASLSLRAQENGKETEPESAVLLKAFVQTYGLGGGLEYWKYRGTDALTFNLQIGSMKDRHETRIKSIYNDQGGKDFIYDKKNYFYVLDASFGYSKEIIPKDQRNRISLRGTAAAGPSLGFLKPYYVEIAVPTGGGNGIVKEVPYDASLYTYTDIVGEADYFLGMSEMKLVPGANARLSLLMDLSGSQEYIRGVELSAFAEVFFKKVSIMDMRSDKAFFPGASIALLIGNAW